MTVQRKWVFSMLKFVTISDVVTALLNATPPLQALYAVEIPPELAARDIQSRASFSPELQDMFVLKHVTWLDATGDGGRVCRQEKSRRPTNGAKFLSSDCIMNMAES